MKINRILFPTDFSDFASVARNYACELAAEFHAELHLLHVLQFHPTATPDFAIGLALPKYFQEIRAAAEKALESVLDAKWSEGRAVAHAVAEGSPFVEIVRYAREKDIDLIVLATHGRTGPTHALIGSVAENVIRHAPCAVLTVRADEHQFVRP